tara:strand:- start:1475 stop:1636 length:162 start_codon:yes stop_codon:yes gene_type:complete
MKKINISLIKFGNFKIAKKNETDNGTPPAPSRKSNKLKVIIKIEIQQVIIKNL